MSGTDAGGRAGRRVITAAAYLFPAWLILHSIRFWGHGIIDREALTFVLFYLADRPLLSTIFDPALNDWGLYQARELSYLVDYVDARVFAALLDRKILFFAPLSGIAGLLALAGIYLWGARRVFRVDGITAAMLLSLFLSCIVPQASTAILYRSSKIVLSVLLLAFLFYLTHLLTTPARRSSWWRAAGVFALGLMVTLPDRQGFFYLLVATAVLSALWAIDGFRTRSFQTGHGSIVAACVAAVLAATLYNLSLAPRAIHGLNGYWPDFSYQELPLRDLLSITLASRSWEMLQTQSSYFFGNLPPWLVGTVTATACVRAAWRTRTIDTLLIAGATVSSAVLLLALMILRHPPVYEIPDHALWYYTLTLHVVLLFALTLLVSVSTGPARLGPPFLLPAIALLLIVNNVRHYPGQREAMIRSRQWFATQYEHSQQFVREFEAMVRQPVENRASDLWMQVVPAGVSVSLPAERPSFLAGVQAAYATLKHRPPLDRAPGPYWNELETLLLHRSSPLNAPEEVGDALHALRAVGVRRVTVDRTRFRDPALLSATIQALVRPEGTGARRSDDGRVLRVDFPDSPAQSVPREAVHAVPWQTFTATASHSPATLARAFDGDPESRWSSERSQTGNESIQVWFDRPRDIRKIRIELTPRDRWDYPRRLLVSSSDGGVVRTLYNDNPLELLMPALLRARWKTPIQLDIPLPENRTRELVLHQTGSTSSWYWSIHELSFWEE